jgi:hypothetical protein
MFDALSPGDVSLPMALLTAYGAALKESGGIDAFAYYDCAQNNPGTLRGQSWQRSGPMFGAAKSIAEAWNAAVQRSSLPSVDKKLLLFREQEVRRTCALVSKIAQANPARARAEIESFHPHLSESARINVEDTQRFAPPHAAYIAPDEFEAHVRQCTARKERDAQAARKMTRAVCSPDDGVARPDGVLTVSNGEHYPWVPLDMATRSAVSGVHFKDPRSPRGSHGYSANRRCYVGSSASMRSSWRNSSNKQSGAMEKEC